MRAEGLSCSLGVLYGGLGISKLQFLMKKIKIKFLVVNFFQFLIIKPWIRIRDPDPKSGSAIRKNAGSGSVSGSALNQCGSETLIVWYIVKAVAYVYSGMWHITVELLAAIAVLSVVLCSPCSYMSTNLLTLPYL